MFVTASKDQVFNSLLQSCQYPKQTLTFLWEHRSPNATLKHSMKCGQNEFWVKTTAVVHWIGTEFFKEQENFSLVSISKKPLTDHSFCVDIVYQGNQKKDLSGSSFQVEKKLSLFFKRQFLAGPFEINRITAAETFEHVTKRAKMKALPLPKKTPPQWV